jgi:hypothetical protein
MRPHERQVDRLADLFWLMARCGSGLRLRGEPFALGLAASAVGEALTQPGLVNDTVLLTADPVVARVLSDVVAAGRQEIVKSPRLWVEWLAQEQHRRTEWDVVARMAAAGLLGYQGRHPVPVDQWVACAPLTVLTAALDLTQPVPDRVKLLAGISASCGLADRLAGPTADRLWPLQQLARRLSPPLLGLVEALDDALHAVAVRHR